MASDIQESPFVKELASSDRRTREKALESLRIYLSSNRQLTDIELLKLWRGLFFCLWHTPPPLPSQNLCASLSTLLLPLPPRLFAPFLRAFWTTMTTNYTSIPSLRLDKYLLLMRHYIRSAFQYLRSQRWERGLVAAWTEVMEDGPLSARDGKVPDGVRYHVLDVWVEEMVGVFGGEKGEGEVVELLMRPVGRAAKDREVWLEQSGFMLLRVG
ncbi:MAG: hypothetical protein LQ345_002529 [Seirophora villosa]|nr:MAG: hypothetical protein LQ345_002529 [Seirophora villosa]